MNILQYGDKGDQVKQLQTALGITSDGDFGYQTLLAVYLYQEANDLYSDGIVGPLTQKSLGLVKSRSKRIVNTISIHCSATKEDQDFSVTDIRKWHLRRGWSDVGYHYVIRLDGTVEKGRAEYKIPAAVAHHNTDNLAICYIGGLDADDLAAKDTRTPEQKDALRKIVREKANKYGIVDSDIKGHRDFPNVAKACPCYNVQQENY